MDKKTVVWYRPGQQAKALRLELTLENMQKLVGGGIQIVPLEPKSEWEFGFSLVCNEDGKNKFFNKPLFPLLDNNGNTVDVIFGPCFIAGRLVRDEDGSEEFAELTSEDLKKIVGRFGRGKVEKNETVNQELSDCDRKQLAACQRMLAKLRARKNGVRSLRSTAGAGGD